MLSLGGSFRYLGHFLAKPQHRNMRSREYAIAQKLKKQYIVTKMIFCKFSEVGYVLLMVQVAYINSCRCSRCLNLGVIAHL